MSFFFNPTVLMLSLIASGIGFVLFSYGRKQQRLPLVIGGILMMVYPYVVSTLAELVIVGTLIGAGTWMAARR